MGNELDRALPGTKTKDQSTRAAKARTLNTSLAHVAGAVGNRNMGRLMQRETQHTPLTSGQANLPITTWEVGPAEIKDAEIWMLYIALRHLSDAPKVPIPDRYATGLKNLDDAIWGATDAGRNHPLTEAKAFVKNLRDVHNQLEKGHDTRVYDLADVALKRAEINAGKSEGELALAPTGATQMDEQTDLVGLYSRAGTEIEEAKEMGYEIPEELSNTYSTAWNRSQQLIQSYEHHSPSSETAITPTAEANLVTMRDAGLEAINAAHAKRAADLARQHTVEAAAIEAAAEKQMVQLRAMAADRRRALFKSGKKSELSKLHEAVGEITKTVDDMKGAAKIITKRVDQLNSIAQMVTESGKKPITLPAIPKGMTEVGDKLKEANEKLGKVLDLLELAGPAKTKLDEGLKYLKGLDMTLDHFSSKLSKGNPFLNVYINGYLKPGIENCIAQLGKIAEIQSSENRSIIESGDPKALLGVNWAMEYGGEDVYMFLAQLFKVGAGASLDDAAWEFLMANRDDLGAAVDDSVPTDRRSFGGWAFSHRYLIWESFYGSARPPR